MGRIVDLCGEIAAAAEEGPEGLILPPDVWDRLRGDWGDEDIEDALGLVNDSLMQAELVESADTLSARLVDILGAFGSDEGFKNVMAEGARLTPDLLGQITRRVDRLEEILELYREGSTPDRSGFDHLQRRLANLGIEEEMERAEPVLPGEREEEED
jgi:hypothetical protein